MKLPSSFWNTSEMLSALRERYIAWERAGLPSCDARMRDVLPRLNLSPEIVTVFCCEGHLYSEAANPEELSYNSNIFMVMFAVSKDGAHRMLEFYDALVNRCDDDYLRCMIELKFSQSGNPLDCSDNIETYPTVTLECIFNEDEQKSMFFELLHRTLNEHTL